MSKRSLLESLAKRYVWWLKPREAVKRVDLLLCQLMQLGTWDDVRHARAVLGDESLRAALAKAPPGILDARSWNYWNLFYGRVPVPPMPTRPLR